jgi:hypothetical protein
MTLLKMIGSWLCVACVIALYLNPSPKEFNEYIRTQVNDYDGKIVYSRISNYMFSSVYEYKVVKQSKKNTVVLEEGYYKAFLGNFYLIYTKP